MLFTPSEPRREIVANSASIKKPPSGIDKDKITHMITTNNSQIRGCYQTALAGKPKLALAGLGVAFDLFLEGVEFVREGRALGDEAFGFGGIVAGAG